MLTAGLIAFQFHKGTIKTESHYWFNDKFFLDFNSIKVRLKQDLEEYNKKKELISIP